MSTEKGVFSGKKVKLNPSELSKTLKKSFKARFLSLSSRLSSSFLIVISVLPITGLLLGIGGSVAALADYYKLSNLKVVGAAISNFGAVPFANLGVLFCVAIAISYAERGSNKGVAGLVGLLSFLLFNTLISFFLVEIKTGENTGKYNFLFFNEKFGIPLGKGQIGSVLGIQTLNSGVIGGIVVGFISAWVYNKFYNFQAPGVVAFFSGVRFLLIAAFFVIIPFTFIFMVIWPFLGLGLGEVGNLTAGLKTKGNYPKYNVLGAISSGLFNMIHRALNTPWGLHHAFYLPLWQTSAGGSAAYFFNQLYHNDLNAGGKDSATADEIWKWMGDNGGLKAPWDDGKGLWGNGTNVLTQADFGSNFENFKKIYNSVGDQTVSTTIMTIMNETNLEEGHGFFLQDMIRMGLPLGRFGPSGWFPYMIFGLPLAALAMYLSVPKENRSKVKGIYLSAGLTSLLTGITEPIEIPFYFANPILFYAVYIPICGISGFFTNLFHVSVPSVFGGIIELFSWGILPMFRGHVTNFWVIPFIGLPLGAIFFFAFLFLVLKLNIKVVGRENVAGDSIKFTSFRSWREHIFGVKYTTSGEVIDDPKKRKNKKK